MSRVLAIDAGRTSCRVAVVADGQVEASTTVPAGGTLADPAGAERVRDAITAGAAELGPNARDCARVAGGFAGAWDDWPSIRAFADALRSELGAHEVVVTSDVVIAYAGALGREPGVLVSAGSGAVALGLGDDGELARVDGWGYLLGDAGSGYWIGRAGLEAALRAVDGRGRLTRLVDLARERHGDVRRLHSIIAGDPAPARTVAAFATEVVACAADGDAVSAAIIDEAVAELVISVRTAANRTQGDLPAYHVCAVGGLLSGDGLVGRRFADALAREEPEARLRPPAGDALHGAATIAEDAGRLEGWVLRSHARAAATGDGASRTRA